MRFSGQIYPDDTIGYFRIASATGRQPVEPFSAGEFLIGSGSQCHLRFGDPGIAAVHAQVTVTKQTVTLNCLCSEPVLLVNGEPVVECQLYDGDMLEILDHRMLFRLALSTSRITLDEDSFAAQALTLNEVVDRLQEQIELVEELQHSPENNAAELIRAATEAGRAARTPAPTMSAPSAELQQILTLMQKQQDASRIRMESLTEVLNNVVRQQKMIADTLEVMSGRIQALDITSYPQRRASA